MTQRVIFLPRTVCAIRLVIGTPAMAERSEPASSRHQESECAAWTQLGVPRSPVACQPGYRCLSKQFAFSALRLVILLLLGRKTPGLNVGITATLLPILVALAHPRIQAWEISLLRRAVGLPRAVTTRSSLPLASAPSTLLPVPIAGRGSGLAMSAVRLGSGWDQRYGAAVTS